MDIVWWVAGVVVAANVYFGTLLLLGFREETRRAADARHRREAHRRPWSGARH